MEGVYVVIKTYGRDNDEHSPIVKPLAAFENNLEANLFCAKKEECKKDPELDYEYYTVHHVRFVPNGLFGLLGS